MRLKSIELLGFKSFARKTSLEFSTAITSVVGPNGSGKSNIAESFRFVLGEQSMKSMRGRRGEDMIWNGSNATPRSSRASVKLVFDNTDRTLSLDFDEVILERVVHRDGANEYLLNGSQVRLRDISELLSGANIGSSGHHIISQGEADRVLGASPKERRLMIEDALGLTAFLYKREEAEKKLDKTADNMREVEGLRRELAPQVKYLEAQVKKIQDSQKLRDDLRDKYLEYLKRESVYVKVARGMIDAQSAYPKEQYREIEQKIAVLKVALQEKTADSGAQELVRLEQELRQLAHKKDSTSRELGRIEGELIAEERIQRAVEESVPGHMVREFALSIESELGLSFEVSESEAKQKIQALIIFTKDFLRRITHVEETTAPYSKEQLLLKKEELQSTIERLTIEEKELQNQVQKLRTAIEGEKDASREAERALFEAMAARSKLEITLAQLQSREEMLRREEQQFSFEISEAVAHIGRTVEEYGSLELRDERAEIVSDAAIAEEPRHIQEERKKKIERLKIRLEESGIGNSTAVLKEYEETKDRDAFLMRELQDLEASGVSLRQLLEDLRVTLETRFESGIEKINSQFNSFFTLMFGGGSATLTLTKPQVDDTEDDENEMDPLASPSRSNKDIEQFRGIEIAITLPGKRLKGLHMLSGGERALTSIALIFAMSQVNPPPFLILDETDAALDEANSRRYGDMIATLAKHSQLILITHNRETMSRAGVLYGVTMGSDGVSKLLSVKFEDALAVAK